MKNPLFSDYKLKHLIFTFLVIIATLLLKYLNFAFSDFLPLVFVIYLCSPLLLKLRSKNLSAKELLMRVSISIFLAYLFFMLNIFMENIFILEINFITSLRQFGFFSGLGLTVLFFIYLINISIITFWSKYLKLWSAVVF